MVGKSNIKDIINIGKLIEGKVYIWKLSKFLSSGYGKKFEEMFCITNEEFEQESQKCKQEYKDSNIVEQEYKIKEDELFNIFIDCYGKVNIHTKEGIKSYDSFEELEKITNKKNFLVTHLFKSEDILALANYIQSTGIQISEDIDIEEVKKVKENTSRKIIKTVVTTDSKAMDKIKLYEPYCDFFLLDSRDSGYTGGTGKENNWKMCKELIKLTQKPVFIAGELNPENVRGAIKETMPYGVDVSTGISSYSESYLRKDRKDANKIEKFIKIAKEY